MAAKSLIKVLLFMSDRTSTTISDSDFSREKRYHWCSVKENRISPQAKSRVEIKLGPVHPSC